MGLSPPHASGRPAGAHPATGDRGAWSSGAWRCSTASTRRASSTSARAPARSRSRSPTSARTRRVVAVDVSAEALALAPRTRARTGLATGSSCAVGNLLDGRGRAVRPRRLEPAVRSARGARDAAARDPRLGAARGARRRGLTEAIAEQACDSCGPAAGSSLEFADGAALHVAGELLERLGYVDVARDARPRRPRARRRGPSAG